MIHEENDMKLRVKMSVFSRVPIPVNFMRHIAKWINKRIIINDHFMLQLAKIENCTYSKHNSIKWKICFVVWWITIKIKICINWSKFKCTYNLWINVIILFVLKNMQTETNVNIQRIFFITFFSSEATL